MGQIKDMTGLRFGRLAVLRMSRRRNGTLAMWWCRCDCGNVKTYNGSDLRKGHSRSCGCLQRDTVSAIRGKHRDCASAEFRAWANMLTRCYNLRLPAAKHYSGRGIGVCDRWRHSYENFLADMGRRPSSELSLDRINNDLGYSPDNCRWATRSEQMKNRRKFKTPWLKHHAKD